jgi:hypothetical protein
VCDAGPRVAGSSPVFGFVPTTENFVPLYEIVLRFPDRDEIRLTDRNGYRVGQEITIAGRSYRVTGTEEPRETSAGARFVLEPASGFTARRESG